MQILEKATQPISSVPDETVGLTKKAYSSNSVAMFLTHQFGSKLAQEIIRKCEIGTARGGAILWFRDCSDKYRTGKIIQVDEQNGMILNEGDELIHQMFSRKHGLGFTYRTCLFNAHLTTTLEYAAFPAGIVQGEMLAIALTGLIPEVVWLSAQDEGEFSSKTIASFFKETPVLLFPKADSLIRWTEEAVGFDPNYVKVSDQFGMLYDQGNKLDLGKDAPHMLQAIAHVKSLLKESDDYFESTLTKE